MPLIARYDRHFTNSRFGELYHAITFLSLSVRKLKKTEVHPIVENV